MQVGEESEESLRGTQLSLVYHQYVLMSYLVSSERCGGALICARVYMRGVG
jgi:hypothetical protein